jgi:hypothetical protein
MGDFFSHARAWWHAKGSSNAKESIAKAVRAAEIIGLNTRQSEYDSNEARATRDVLSSLEGTALACVKVGSLLIVKYPVEGEAIVLVRTLSVAEMNALEKFPEILSRPRRVFQELSMALAALETLSAESLDGGIAETSAE